MGSAGEDSAPERGTGRWASLWLARCAAAVSCAGDVPSALAAGADVAAACFDVDAAAVITSDDVLAMSAGRFVGPLSPAELRAARAGRGSLRVRAVDVAHGEAGNIAARHHVAASASPPAPTRDLPVLAAAPLFDADGAALVLVDAGMPGLTGDEAAVLEAMAQTLSLALRSHGLLEASARDRAVLADRLARAEEAMTWLRQRAYGSERLSLIHQSIAARMTLRDVLDAVVAAAGELLGAERVSLRLLDPNQPHRSEIVAHLGISAASLAQLRQAPVDRGMSRRSIAANALVVESDYARSDFAHPHAADEGFTAAMAAPVRENGRPVGSLVVASRRPGRRYDEAAQELLTALAEHASVALTDARTVKALEDALCRARHQAEHDELTGLPNRQRLLTELEKALTPDVAGEVQPLAALLIDIDGFKVVNETSGHVAGDELLRLMAGRIRVALPSGELVARLGADEFGILLAGDDALTEAACQTAERLARALSVPFAVRGRELLATVSIGVTTARAGDAAGDVLRHADVALHSAKVSGRGRSAVFADHMAEAVLARTLLESDLRHVIERGELLVAYQPIVSLATGRTVGTEALVRWNRDGVMVAPLDFIPVAEDTGDIIGIGTWVLREATAQAHIWNDLPVSVNVSVRQLLDDGFAAEVVRALEDSGLPPSHLTLEITESVVLHDTTAALSRIDGLRQLGVRFALDDFGTGYSSLSYLRRLPIDVLKIDKSFTSGIGCDADDTLLVRAIVELASTLGITTVAEGVETDDQRTALEALGCTFGQGFLFARPKTADLMGEHGPHWLDTAHTRR